MKLLRIIFAPLIILTSCSLDKEKIAISCDVEQITETNFFLRNNFLKSKSETALQNYKFLLHAENEKIKLIVPEGMGDSDFSIRLITESWTNENIHASAPKELLNNGPYENRITWRFVIDRKNLIVEEVWRRDRDFDPSNPIDSASTKEGNGSCKSIPYPNDKS